MVEARRRMCARGIRGRCSRAEEMFRCQWPSGAGYHHGPAGKDVERLDYRTEIGVDQSERKPGRRNAGNDGGSTGANHADLALTGAAVAVGTWEKREVTGVSRLAPLLKCTSHLGFSLGLGERAGNVLHPVDGLEGPDAPAHGLPASLDLEAETGPVLEPDEEVQLGGLGDVRQVVEGLAGVAAPGKLVVGFGLAVALGVVAAPVWGELRLNVHLMMSLFEIFHDWPVRVEREDRGGGGLARTAAPDHGNFLQ